MQAQFESIFKELGAAAAADESSNPSAGAPPPASSSSFQDNIRRTMERMQASGDSATAAATADSNAEDDFMAELLKQMQGGGAGAGLGGEGGEEEFSKMLLGMMEQLTNKEILYEPMKELHDKFPEWLERNKDKTSAEDLKRYEEQQRLVSEMVVKFEEPTYLDSNAADREYIVDRMQKVSLQICPDYIPNIVLTPNRCKLRAPRLLIWWVICPLHRRRLVHQTQKPVRHNSDYQCQNAIWTIDRSAIA